MVALPVNRPKKERSSVLHSSSELNTKCICAETTTGFLRKTNAKFKYSPGGSVHCITFMYRPTRQLLAVEDGQELNFRVMVTICDQ